MMDSRVASDFTLNTENLLVLAGVPDLKIDPITDFPDLTNPLKKQTNKKTQKKDQRKAMKLTYKQKKK